MTTRQHVAASAVLPSATRDLRNPRIRATTCEPLPFTPTMRFETEGSMKYVNIILMVLMAALCLREGWDIVQHGADMANVLFCLLFGTFAVRRFMLMSKYS